MATRQLLSGLAQAYRLQSGMHVVFESVGGVDAAKRVMAGEAFDLVVLASDAMDKLIAAGKVHPDSKTDLVHSAVAIAVRAGSVKPDISSEASLQKSVLAARSIGYSTGPSGTALLKLFERWGIADMLSNRIVQAPAGVPVGQLVASGEVELGFQQQSELAELPGIEVIGLMPEGCEIETTFSAGLCTASKQPGAVIDFLAYMHSPDVAQIKLHHHMQPAS